LNTSRASGLRLFLTTAIPFAVLMGILRLSHMPISYLIANTFAGTISVTLFLILNDINRLRWWSAAAVGALGGAIFASASGNHLFLITLIAGSASGLAIWRICKPRDAA